MTPLERLAAIKASSILQRTTMTNVAKSCGVWYNHFWLVVRGQRVGSRVLRAKIAAVIGRHADDVFPARTEE